MKALELAYTRGSMFGRDLFHYSSSAVVFCFCALSPYFLKIFQQSGDMTQIGVEFNLDTWEMIGLTVCLILLSYALGHLLLLFCEMSVFHRLPDVHAAFVERYNTLAFFRLSFASSSLTGGIVCLLALKTVCISYVLPMTMLWLTIGVMLLRQHFITRTVFLDRVAASYLLSISDKK
jgi:hypothetical protein